MPRQARSTPSLGERERGMWQGRPLLAPIDAESIHATKQLGISTSPADILARARIAVTSVLRSSLGFTQGQLEQPLLGSKDEQHCTGTRHLSSQDIAMDPLPV
mmetsp:Transcript_24418/g.32982  ORF Transcript_24418/g.32982 Transcript_24418/m.32982 type:complete len:103 (+) Transcript_24418:117-425(+)